METEKESIDHDRLFKELLEVFFAEFMELFFPEASLAIDLKHVTFLQQEIFTDVTVGEKHRVDIIVETSLKGEPGLILVHVEPQSYVQKEFNERMFVYFGRLYEKFRRKILPIALFSYDTIHDEPDSFELGFDFLNVLRFNFYKVELKKHSWRDYIESDNPVAAALLSKMNFSKEDRIKVKLEFLRMLVRMRLAPARSQLIAGFFDKYLVLTEHEEAVLSEELAKIDQTEVEMIMQITTSWHEKGKAEGKAEEKIETAKKMLMREMQIKDISEITGLRSDEIEELRKQVQH